MSARVLRNYLLLMHCIKLYPKQMWITLEGKIKWYRWVIELYNNNVVFAFSLRPITRETCFSRIFTKFSTGIGRSIFTVWCESLLIIFIRSSTPTTCFFSIQLSLSRKKKIRYSSLRLNNYNVLLFIFSPFEFKVFKSTVGYFLRFFFFFNGIRSEQFTF